jgi:hypothetical protein
MNRVGLFCVVLTLLPTSLVAADTTPIVTENGT